MACGQWRVVTGEAQVGDGGGVCWADGERQIDLEAGLRGGRDAKAGDDRNW